MILAIFSGGCQSKDHSDGKQSPQWISGVYEKKKKKPPSVNPPGSGDYLLQLCSSIYAPKTEFNKRRLYIQLQVISGLLTLYSWMI